MVRKMANRRMFSNQIINSARFLQMPTSSRLLYYDLGMKADDEGFVEAFSVLRMTGASEDDLRILQAKGYIKIINDDMTAYIYDWTINNQIRKDRFQKSIYHNLLPETINEETEEKPEVTQTETSMVAKRQPSGNQTATSGCRSIVKSSKVEDRQVQLSVVKSYTPFPGAETAHLTEKTIPTLDDVIEYAERRGRVDLAERFFDYYDAADWHDGNGTVVRNWKQKFISWELNTPKSQNHISKNQNVPKKEEDIKQIMEDRKRMEKFRKKLQEDVNNGKG